MPDGLGKKEGLGRPFARLELAAGTQIVEMFGRGQRLPPFVEGQRFFA